MAESGLFGLRRVSKRLVPPRTKVLPEVCPFLTIQTPDVGGLSSWSTKTYMTLMSSPRSSAFRHSAFVAAKSVLRKREALSARHR
jgi:hypothetical protein